MLVSLDIETKCGMGCVSSCDHALDPYRNAITIIGAYWEEAGHPYTKIFRTIDELKEFDTQLKPDYLGFNFKWDLHTLAVKGFILPLERWAHDPLLMSSVCTEKVRESYIYQYEAMRQKANAGLPKGFKHRSTQGSSLKIQAPYFLGVDPFWEDPTNHDNVDYVLKDCEYTYKLYQFFEKLMTELDEFSFYENKLMPWVKLLARMERRGVRINLEELDKRDIEALKQAELLKTKLDVVWAPAYAEYFRNKVLELYAKYDEMYAKAAQKAKNPTPEKLKNLRDRYDKLASAARDTLTTVMNIDSPTQLKWLLKDYLKLNIEDYDEEESTGKSVLKRLASEGREDIQLFLDYRMNKKLTTAFFPSYREKHVDSILHASFNAHNVRTGRLSSSNPNLQQVPGHLHSLFVPRPGYKMIVKDEAAIEPRLIAVLTGCPIMYDILSQGLDFHGYNTKVFFELEEEVKDIKKLYSKEREVGKEVGLAILYGAGKNRLSESAQKRGFLWSEAQADHKVKRFREEYEYVYKFRDELKKALLQDKVLNLFGRPIVIQNEEDIHMQGLNTVIQSSASDLVIDSAMKAQEMFDKEGLEAHILLLVHDEIVAEAKEEHAKRAEEILDHCMTNYKLTTEMGDIKLKVEGSIGDAWVK